MPCDPMVKAMAPKAPIGATLTTRRMMPKKTRVALSMALLTGFPASPIREMATPERMETSSTCSRSPAASAPK
jgi:hypothetical protein